MGSPDGADNLTLADIEYSISNSLNLFEDTTNATLGCVIPVEIGAINSIVPLIAAAMANNNIQWVVDGDGAGRAVPELPQTTYSGSATLGVSPCALANDVSATTEIQSGILTAATAAQVETLAGGIVAAFGSFSGIALWPSNASNGFALSGSYIPGTLAQAQALGQFLFAASSHRTATEVVSQISGLTGSQASATITNFYITSITQSTASASLDAGVIRLDNSFG